ncbi:MGC82914 protein [Xenopus laevis]|uniref:MGC82914 protein n=1 Tax=Xenopus laevis TaxID=8355 RepID=Q6GNA8_XENLA|nr:uncharacterized protein LOC444392 [Xenopus laevis]AAH73607.1 MGC82914 protein [Xenopus laevis]
MEHLSAPSSLISFSSTAILGLALLIFALILDLVKYRRRESGYPPGPSPLPFVGNVFLLDPKDIPTSLSKLRKRYGNIYSLQLFWEKAVVLNGVETIKEAFITKSEDTADRCPIPIFEYLGFHKGFAFAKYGQSWKDLRRFSISTFRDFGMGKKTIEEPVREEASYLCTAIQAKEGCPFDPFLLLNQAVSNLNCSIIFGERYDYSDKAIQKLLFLLQERFHQETGTVSQILNNFPRLIKIVGPHLNLFKVQNAFLDYLKAKIKEHKDTWDPTVTRDYIDAFFEEIEKTKGNPQSSFNETALLYTIADLFVAGSETTSNTLRWSILMMLLNPQIQYKVHEEIDQVIGRDRKPRMEDQRNMPYTNAVIHETQRYGNILPMALFHMTYRDTNIQGYNIPKGTTIIPNLTSVLKDETIWEHPYQFYPEHFLDSEGKFVKREAFIPFSAGKHMCAGEALAKMELFLFFVSLFQHFEFQIPTDQPRPRNDPVFIFSYTPHPFKVCAIVR